jgi:hypothetical protein
MEVRGNYEQSYNAQANEKQQLVPTLGVVSSVIHQVANVLGDSG